MARYTYERWNALVQKGAVSRQDADTYKSTYEASAQNVESLEKAVNAAQEQYRGGGSESRPAFRDMQGYLKVKAPFAGVITQRNIDTGALVTRRHHAAFPHCANRPSPHLCERAADGRASESASARRQI